MGMASMILKNWVSNRLGLDFEGLPVNPNRYRLSMHGLMNVSKIIGQSFASLTNQADVSAQEEHCKTGATA